MFSNSNFPSDRKPGRVPAWILFVGAGVFLVGIIGLLSVGCTGNSSPGTRSQKSGSASAEVTDQKCSDFILNILDVFQLNRLGISARTSDGVVMLNQWQKDCRVTNHVPLLDQAVQNLLSTEQLTAINERRYSIQDGERLRDCALFRKVSEYAIGSADNDLDRVVNLFDHVVRNVDLVTKHYEDLPLTPYESYLFGSGTAEDRAWIFISLLRQLKIDAVIVSPKKSNGGEATAGSPFFVGVLLNDEVYLFEPRFGLPVRPASGDAAAATLAQVVATPDLLKQFDLSDKQLSLYSDATPRDPQVEIVGDTSLFSARMETLQPQFSGDRATIISDPLQDVDDQPGLLSRVAKVKEWPSSAVRLWSYPESQLSAYAKVSEDQQGKLQGLRSIWDAPRGSAATTAGPGGSTSVRKLIHARIAHVSGDYSGAIRAYNLVRVNGRAVPGQLINAVDQFVNNQASDHAFYWKGICQFENGDVKGAKDTFEKYLAQSKPGLWQAACRYQLARCQADTGDFAAAIATLEATPENDYHRTGHLLLAREWRQKLKK